MTDRPPLRYAQCEREVTRTLFAFRVIRQDAPLVPRSLATGSIDWVRMPVSDDTGSRTLILTGQQERSILPYMARQPRFPKVRNG